MAQQRLPIPSSDAGQWGTILNNHLKQISFSNNGGGLNTYIADPIVSAVTGSALNTDDNGYTYFNSKYNSVRRYDQPSASSIGKWTTILEGINVWSAATRPASTSLNASNVGMLGINTDTKIIERFDGTTFVPVLTTKGVSAYNLMFGFELGTATAGDHFVYNTSGGTYIVQLPQGALSAKIDNINLYINTQNAAGFPSSVTIVKIFRRPQGSVINTEVASFAVPANSNSSSAPLSIPSNLIPNIVLNQGDKLYVNLSQACLDVDFTIGANIVFN
jgi:hypothetical protein